MEVDEAKGAALLKEVHHDKLMEYLPVMIFYAVLAILGILGNTCTIRFYSTEKRKSSTSVLIQCLGVIDFCVCIIVFPSIANLAVNVYFTNAGLCRLMYFLDHSFILSSVLVLWIISIDRYLKVCRPLGRQLPTTWAKPIVVVVIIFSTALSSLDFLAYDSVPVELKFHPQNYSKTLATREMVPDTNVSIHNGTNNGSFAPDRALYGHYCTTTENKKVQSLLKIFNAIEVTVIAIILLTFITAYGRILHVLLKNSKRRKCYGEDKSEEQDDNGINAKPKSMDMCKLSEKAASKLNNVASTSHGTNNNSALSPDRNSDCISCKRSLSTIYEVQLWKERNHITMKNNSTFEDYDILQEIHQEKQMEFLPIMILLTVLAALGIVGNSFTIRFYSAQREKSSTYALIQYLGVIDLIVCVFSFESVADLAVNIYFTFSIWCKFMYFFTHSFVFSSVFVLWIISIDRYLKVCRPLGRQLSTTWVKPIVVVVFIFSIIVSSCNFFTYDIVQVELKLDPNKYSKISAGTDLVPVANISANIGTNNGSMEPAPVSLYGHYCTITENPKVQLFVKIFNVVEVTVIVVILLTFVVAYGKILQLSLKSSKRRAKYNFNKEQNQDNNKHKCIIGEHARDMSELSEKSTSMPNIVASVSDDLNNSNNTHSRGRGEIHCMHERNITMNKRKVKVAEANISAMMATVTLGFVLSFIPYFIIAGTRTQTNTSESELDVWHQLALRSPYLNSVINPIIFCIFNPRYRKYIKRVFVGNDQTENTTSPKLETNTET